MEPSPSVFKRGWEMLWERPAAYALVGIFPYLVVPGLPMLIGRLVVSFHPAFRQLNPVTLWDSMAWGTRLLVILAISALSQVPMYMGARGVCRLALEEQSEVEISMGAALWDTLRFLPTALLYFLLLGIATSLGGAFFVVPGLLIASACALIIPAGIDGQLGPLAAIRRGISLGRRVFGRTLGVYASYLALVVAGRVVLNVLAASDEGPGFAVFVLLAIWLAGIVLGMAPVNIMITLLYCQANEMDAASLLAEASSGSP